jgi:glycosyltransferase involved in cell wall biosynthesis
MHSSTSSHRRPEGAAIVIPAYNEATRIQRMLPAVLQADGISRIVVVDDGSTDGTSQVACLQAAGDPRFELIRFDVNRGKAFAMAAGAEQAGAPIIIFLDADLIGLQPGHIRALLRPVQAGAAEMAVGVFRHGRWMTDMAHRCLPILSGQRCLRWSCFTDLEGLSGFRSGVEAAFNLHALLRGLRVRHVFWSGVTHTMKPEKSGYARGGLLYLRMNREIAHAALHTLTAELRARQRRVARSLQRTSGS